MPENRGPRRPGKPPRRPAVGGKPAFRAQRGMGGRPPRAVAPRPAVPPAEGGEDAPAPTGDRLQKVLAAAGLASRRECEELITEGRVEVDGVTVTELGARVDRSKQEIRVDGEPLSRPKLVYYAVNKPTGVVTTARDPAGRPRVIDLLPPSVGRVFTVGRLDLASEGLILLTNDGELANQLTHPKHGVEKTYEVQVAGLVEPDILSQLRHGVHLSEGFAHAVHARIKSRLKKSTLLEMVLDEGRNREVRRLLARLGHKVQRLVRVAVGPVRLGDMPRGAHRRLTQEEVRKLRDAIAAGPKPRGDGAGGAATARPGGPKPFGRKPLGKKPFAGKPLGAGPRPAGRKYTTGKPGTPKKVYTTKPPAGGELPTVNRRVVGAGTAPPQGEGRPQGRKPPSGGPRTGQAGGGPRGGRPGARGGAGGRPAAGSGGRPAAGAGGAGKPPAGKPKYRPPTGTKAVGRKPIKRRRPERPQRGSNKG